VKKKNCKTKKLMPKVKVRFAGKQLTSNAGLVPLGKFVEQLGLSELLDRKLTVERGENAKYSTSFAVLATLLGIAAGAKHLSHMIMIKSDSVIRKLFGWDDFPHESTFGRIFHRFTYRNIVEFFEVENHIRRRVWNQKWVGKVTLDMDSSVKGVYGNQEGAKKGYNPHKRGQKSYHPLLCFIAQNRECLHHWFRDGSAYTSNGAATFISECLARLPKRVWKVFVRADSGFFDGDLLDLLEERFCQYLIKVKLKNLINLLSWQDWRKCNGFETTEFMHQCAGWKRARRFVAVRELIREETEGRLFPLREYKYFCYVTNLDTTPMTTHRCYGKRSTSENWIEMVKNQVYAGMILTNSFWANSILFAISVLVYNIMVWMRWLTDKTSWQEEINTFRFWFIHAPAKLVSTGGEFFLDLPKGFFWKERWQKIQQGVQAFQFT
jgi:hypothetical protein